MVTADADGVLVTARGMVVRVVDVVADVDAEDVEFDADADALDVDEVVDEAVAEAAMVAGCAGSSARKAVMATSPPALSTPATLRALAAACGRRRRERGLSMPLANGVSLASAGEQPVSAPRIRWLAVMHDWLE
ncbi:MAG TPA: hypothetical protein VGJ03_08040 [Acidimicrobiales bacterium]